MRHKRRITKVFNAEMMISDEEIALMAEKQKNLKPKQYDVELKETLKETYLPVWEELLMRYYSREMAERILRSIKMKLEPTNTYAVAGLAAQMESILGILELVHTGKVDDAKALYLASGTSFMDRNLNLIDYLSSSYYAKELLDVMSKDIMQTYFNDARAYQPVIKNLKANAERSKRQGTAEMVVQLGSN